ncbi:Ras protein-specific guanine nucleotide-releasing factor [Branchiostoma belcheri]|nr:Ras protein-specific guanine nucleotide-releasing factor [Branchiostoma belcheri]
MSVAMPETRCSPLIANPSYLGRSATRPRALVLSHTCIIGLKTPLASQRSHIRQPITTAECNLLAHDVLPVAPRKSKVSHTATHPNCRARYVRALCKKGNGRGNVLNTLRVKRARVCNPGQHLFCISYKQEGQRQYDLRAETEPDRESWVMAINRASYQVLSQQREELEQNYQVLSQQREELEQNYQVLSQQREELEQKYLHLLQIVESEKTANYQVLSQQREELEQKYLHLLQIVESEKTANYQVLSQQREELEQKYLHLLQIVESEKTAKWQLIYQVLSQQREELETEVPTPAADRGDYQVLSQQREELEQKYLHLLQIVESEKTAKWQLMYLHLLLKQTNKHCRISFHSYQVLSQQREELEQKYLHLLQIVESEKTAKWQLMRSVRSRVWRSGDSNGRLTKGSDTGNGVNVVKLIHLRKEQQSAEGSTEEESDDIKKIKKESNNGSGSGRFTQDVCKVQSFLRGWLCRRRWKSIVQDYIRSPHAESMRKRNQVRSSLFFYKIVFTMVECEEEYVTQLSTLVTCFLRPLKMSASSKKRRSRTRTSTPSSSTGEVAERPL